MPQSSPNTSISGTHVMVHVQPTVSSSVPTSVTPTIWTCTLPCPLTTGRTRWWVRLLSITQLMSPSVVVLKRSNSTYRWLRVKTRVSSWALAVVVPTSTSRQMYRWRRISQSSSTPNSRSVVTKVPVVSTWEQVVSSMCCSIVPPMVCVSSVISTLHMPTLLKKNYSITPTPRAILPSTSSSSTAIPIPMQ